MALFYALLDLLPFALFKLTTLTRDIMNVVVDVVLDLGVLCIAGRTHIIIPVAPYKFIKSFETMVNLGSHSFKPSRP